MTRAEYVFNKYAGQQNPYVGKDKHIKDDADDIENYDIGKEEAIEGGFQKQYTSKKDPTKKFLVTSGGNDKKTSMEVQQMNNQTQKGGVESGTQRYTFATPKSGYTGAPMSSIAADFSNPKNDGSGVTNSSAKTEFFDKNDKDKATQVYENVGSTFARTGANDSKDGYRVPTSIERKYEANTWLPQISGQGQSPKFNGPIVDANLKFNKITEYPINVAAQKGIQTAKTTTVKDLYKTNKSTDDDY